MEISQVATQSGVPASTLSKASYTPSFGVGVIERLELIALGRVAGFSLEEIASILGAEENPNIDRDLLLRKASELDKTI